MLKLADFDMNYLNWLSNWIKENNLLEEYKEYADLSDDDDDIESYLSFEFISEDTVILEKFLKDYFEIVG